MFGSAHYVYSRFPPKLLGGGGGRVKYQGALGLHGKFQGMVKDQLELELLFES